MRIYHSILLLIIICSAVFLRLEAAVILLVLTTVYFSVFDKPVFVRISKLRKKLSIWILIFLLLIVNPILTNGDNSLFMGLNYSNEAFSRGLRMITRFLLIITAFNYFRIYNPGIFAPEKLNKIPGLSQFTLVFEEARVMFPRTKQLVSGAWLKHRETDKDKRKGPADFIAGIFSELVEKQHENKQ